MNYIMIIQASTNQGWDLSTGRILTFYNLRKLFHFAMYYSSKNDVLIRVYIRNNWLHSFVNGKEIWNAY